MQSHDERDMEGLAARKERDRDGTVKEFAGEARCCSEVVDVAHELAKVEVSKADSDLAKEQGLNADARKLCRRHTLAKIVADGVRGGGRNAELLRGVL